STYIPYQSSTASLPSPVILRSLPNGVADTYDVDTGVLTRRCGEVVLNGSESGWSIVSQSVETGFVKFKNLISTITTVTSSSKNDFAINDKFQHVSLGEVMSNFGGNPFTTGSPTKEFFVKHNNANEIVISIAKSKLSTPDVAGFKSWLAQNPTTVVYQLAESTTEYIENNGQLRSFDYQTTVSAESVVPVKLSGNIPVNYASTLNTLSTTARELKLENLSLIEQAELLEQQLITANETNDYQDSLIDVSLLATDELYTLIEPLLPELFSNTKGGNAMVDAYVAMVIKGLKTIEEVPSRYREEVKRVLAELEK
ncbi:MAG: CD1375 family protein, partial [Bacilli bacterium]